MVGPPSEEIQEAVFFVFNRLRNEKGGVVMGNDPANWLVLGIMVGFISFVVWVKISSMRENKKTDQDEVKKGKGKAC